MKHLLFVAVAVAYNLKDTEDQAKFNEYTARFGKQYVSHDEH
jgi:hypothetical protein